jgi:hypothetical protein
MNAVVKCLFQLPYLVFVACVSCRCASKTIFLAAHLLHTYTWKTLLVAQDALCSRREQMVISPQRSICEKLIAILIRISTCSRFDECRYSEQLQIALFIERCVGTVMRTVFAGITTSHRCPLSTVVIFGIALRSSSRSLSVGVRPNFSSALLERNNPRPAYAMMPAPIMTRVLGVTDLYHLEVLEWEKRRRRRLRTARLPYWRRAQACDTGEAEEGMTKSWRQPRHFPQPIMTGTRYLHRTAPTFDFGELPITGWRSPSSVPLDRHSPHSMAW